MRKTNFEKSGLRWPQDLRLRHIYQTSEENTNHFSIYLLQNGFIWIAPDSSDFINGEQVNAAAEVNKIDKID